MKRANHYHVNWSCPKLALYWEKIKHSIDRVLKTTIPLILRPCSLVNDQTVCKVYRWNIMPIASKKVITRKWMTDKLPTQEEWTNLVKDIAQMERLTFALRREHDKFEEFWKPCTNCMNT